MKTTTLKTSLTIVSMIVCLLSMNSGLAQRHVRRLPDKALTLQLIEEETKQTSVKNYKGTGAYYWTKFNLLKGKPAVEIAPYLLNRINYTQISASVFNQPNRINGLFKRKYSPSFK